MELTYRQEGDYLLPKLTVPEAPKIGKFGMLRRSFLRSQRNGIYTGMMISGKLNSHLEEIDQKADEMMDFLTTQIAKSEGVTENLKASDQMRWVEMMNNIRNRAEEAVMADLIYS